MSDPAAAADELTRSVKHLGFVGALINNHDSGIFYDNETYWPFFARAQELDVPIYIHPSNPPEKWASRFQGNYPSSVASSLGVSGWDWRKHILDLGSHCLGIPGGKIDVRRIDLSFTSFLSTVFVANLCLDDILLILNVLRSRSRLSYPAPIQ